MQKGMIVLEQNGPWELVTLPPGKKVIGGKWIYTIKLNPDGPLKGEIGCQKLRVYVLDYVDAFSPIVKMTCADYGVGNDLSLTTSSVEHQEWLSQ